MDGANGALIALMTQSGQLKRLPRTGWLLAGIDRPESVADHSFGVCLLTLFLCETINGAWTEHGLTAPLDVGRAVNLALIHDLAESLLTDLPRRSAEFLGLEAKHRAERRAIESILSDLPNGAHYVDLWSEYDAGSTPEARLVKDADKLEMAWQSVLYERSGHPDLAQFRSGHNWHYSMCENLWQSLCELAK